MVTIRLLISNNRRRSGGKKSGPYMHKVSVIIFQLQKIKRNSKEIHLHMNHSMADGVLMQWVRMVRRWKSTRKLLRSLMVSSIYIITGFSSIHSGVGIKTRKISREGQI